jgi:hypothetical protein
MELSGVLFGITGEDYPKSAVMAKKKMWEKIWLQVAGFGTRNLEPATWNAVVF